MDVFASLRAEWCLLEALQLNCAWRCKARPKEVHRKFTQITANERTICLIMKIIGVYSR
jgi:hypothetical protein